MVLCAPLSLGPLGGEGSRSHHLLIDTAGCCCGLVEGAGTGAFPGGVSITGAQMGPLKSSHWPLWVSNSGCYSERVSLFENGNSYPAG